MPCLRALVACLACALASPASPPERRPRLAFARPLTRGGPCVCARLATRQPFIEVAIDYCYENAPLKKDLTSDDVGQTGAFLCSPLAGAVTGHTMYVDNGMHAMGMVQSVAVEQVKE